MTSPTTPASPVVEVKPCPRCGSAAVEMIHPMGNWMGKDIGYGPDGSRIVCRQPDCRIVSPAFYGPDQDAAAIAWWNSRITATEALREAQQAFVDFDALPTQAKRPDYFMLLIRRARAALNGGPA